MVETFGAPEEEIKRDNGVNDGQESDGGDMENAADDDDDEGRDSEGDESEKE